MAIADKPRLILKDHQALSRAGQGLTLGYPSPEAEVTATIAGLDIPTGCFCCCGGEISYRFWKITAATDLNGEHDLSLIADSETDVTYGKDFADAVTIEHHQASPTCELLFAEISLDLLLRITWKKSDDCQVHARIRPSPDLALCPGEVPPPQPGYNASASVFELPLGVKGHIQPLPNQFQARCDLSDTSLATNYRAIGYGGTLSWRYTEP